MSYEKMKNIGGIVARALEEIESFIKPGVTTKQIDEECNRILQTYGAKSSALGYGHPPFPGYVCVSVNYVVCHGVPCDEIIKNGDIVSVDIVANKDGYHGDSCYTFLVNIDDTNDISKKFLIKHTYECMWQAISIIKDGVTVGDLGYAMESYAKKKSLSVVKDFCGHGIGVKMHSEPNIPFYGKRGDGIKLVAGQYITIEPMLLDGHYSKIKILNDGWTAISSFLSAQFEHTVLVTLDGYEVLTFNNYDLRMRKFRLK